MTRQRTKQTKSAHRRQVAHRKQQDFIVRSWAEDGMVFTEDKNGVKKMHTVKEAAIKAVELNKQLAELKNLQMLPGNSVSDLKDQEKRSHTFINRIIELCRLASSQLESGDKKTTLLQNFVEGKDLTGQKLVITDEDTRIEHLVMQLHTLDEHDIRAMLRNKTVTNPEMQEKILSRMHTQNMAAAANFEKGKDLIL
jgi:hypothetical protein